MATGTVMGLDSSTSCTGWSIVRDGELVAGGYIKTKGKTKFELFDRIVYLTDRLIPIIEEWDVDLLGIESILENASGMTSKKVLIKLAEHNATIRFALQRETGLHFVQIGAKASRKAVLGKAFVKGVDAKSYVRQSLEESSYAVERFYEENRVGNWAQENGDYLDAVVIGLYTWGEFERSRI